MLVPYLWAYNADHKVQNHVLITNKFIFSSFEKRLFSVVVVDDVDVNCNEVAGSESE
jgi:hypothetical protein